MKSRFVILVVVLGCRNSAEPSENQATPREAFESMALASAQQNWSALNRAMTDRGRGYLICDLASGLGWYRAIPEPTERQRKLQMEADRILRKHGLRQEDMAKYRYKTQEESLVGLGFRMVATAPEFYADWWAALSNAGYSPDFLPFTAQEILEESVQDASATVSTKYKGETEPNPLVLHHLFRRVDGAWFYDGQELP